MVVKTSLVLESLAGVKGYHKAWYWNLWLVLKDFDRVYQIHHILGDTQDKVQVGANSTHHDLASSTGVLGSAYC